MGASLAVACGDTRPAPSAHTASSSASVVEPSDAGAPPPSAGASSRPAARIATYPLFEAFPGLEPHVPRVAIGDMPTAVERADGLLSERDRGPIFLKRDDRIADAFGGGKIRKLELYFGEALAQGKRRVVTFGGVGSNQATAVALIGRGLGLEARLYLAPQPPSSLVTRNLGADSASGAELRLFPSVTEAEAAFANEARAGDSSYVIAPGGTTAIGTLGFVNAGLEIASDVRAGRLLAPHRIYIALGLGGSAAGLAIGAKLGGLDAEIVAVRASNATTVTLPTLRTIHEDTIAFARRLDPKVPNLAFADVRIRIDGRFLGAGYGVPTESGDAAADLARSRAALELEPVYTAKALAALLADTAGGQSDPVLFWCSHSTRPMTLGTVSAPFDRFVSRSKG